MTTLTIELDERTARTLSEMSKQEVCEVSGVAARLLARATRAIRPRPTYDSTVLKVAYSGFASEDEALAESDLEHRAQLLAKEDAS